MTDKQIIIDGIDVSGCEWFYKNDPCKNTCKYFCTPCEWVAIQNCMYKYTKRKEQECEELKRQHQGDKGLITSTGKMNYQLIQEYDKLKTENDECIKDNEYLKTIIKDFTQEVVKLKQTLTEIKEIIHFNKTNRLSGGADISIEQILQKISECEGNDEKH